MNVFFLLQNNPNVQWNTPQYIVAPFLFLLSILHGTYNVIYDTTQEYCSDYAICVFLLSYWPILYKNSRNFSIISLYLYAMPSNINHRLCCLFANLFLLRICMTLLVALLFVGLCMVLIFFSSWVQTRKTFDFIHLLCCFTVDSYWNIARKKYFTQAENKWELKSRFRSQRKSGNGLSSCYRRVARCMCVHRYQFNCMTFPIQIWEFLVLFY